MGSGFLDENINPCLKEQALSLKCLQNNNYDKDKCFLPIENYKFCKKFWGKVRNMRRSQGIYPLLPPPEEREKVKADWQAGKFKLDV
ncbi:unnamed protein product [Bemisia tabaci]|uniref:Coiled-coil-helix-coiled-coil-helix domain-containing protein 7 n=1 Tax=Bemisia tabaci TaxID=7038 RepID=A0A9P0F3N9_BEMTA|nr:unnamed protein product [Bemisia tabaci]